MLFPFIVLLDSLMTSVAAPSSIAGKESVGKPQKSGVSYAGEKAIVSQPKKKVNLVQKTTNQPDVGKRRT
jgi:hypothetical protein